MNYLYIAAENILYANIIEKRDISGLSIGKTGFLSKMMSGLLLKIKIIPKFKDRT